MTIKAISKMTATERQHQIQSIVIEHDRFLEAVEGLKSFHYPVRGGVHARGCVSALIGDSRAGKTFAVKRYARSFPKRIGNSGIIQPVVYVDMPMEGCGGQRGVLESIANALEVPFSLRMTNPLLKDAIIKALQVQQVELLIFDEFDQVFRENDKRLLGFARGLIRKLLDIGTLGIVCVGLPPTYKLLHNDGQLVGRGGLPYRLLRPYNWDNVEERGAFRLLCDVFDQHLPFEERSGLSSVDLAYRLYGASDGNVGRLKGYIDAAAYCAMNDDAACIERRHFIQAYDERRELGQNFNWFRDDPNQAPSPKSTAGVKSGSISKVFSKAIEKELLDGI